MAVALDFTRRMKIIGIEMQKITKIIGAFFLNFLVFSTFQVFSQEYGLVLSGGGGKGAYEVGVWKALSEYGVAQKVTVISGTSVGGLNAGLFAVAPVSQIENIWMNLVPDYLNKDYELISEDGLFWIMNQVCFSRLQQKNSYPKVWVTATRARFTGLKLLTKWLLGIDYSHRFLLNEEYSEDEIRRKLLATSACPILTKTVLLDDGYTYIDGGTSDNCPIIPILENYNPSQIFVVYLEREPTYLRSREYPDYNIVDFVPTEKMGGIDGMLDFSYSEIKLKMDLGYTDTVRILNDSGLKPVSSYWFD